MYFTALECRQYSPSIDVDNSHLVIIYDHTYTAMFSADRAHIEQRHARAH
jgi:hypothetical protein